MGPNLLQRAGLLPFVYLDLPMGANRRRRAKPALMSLFARVYGRKLRQVLAGFDLVHTFNVEYLGSACIAVAGEIGVPCVATPQIHPGRWLDDAFTMGLLAQCDFVFAALEYDRRFMIEHGVPEDKVQAVGAPFDSLARGDASAFRRYLGLDTQPLVCFVGVKRPYKGYNKLLKAAPLVWQEFPETRFVFIGSRTRHSEKRFSRIADPRILEFGHVDAWEKNGALASCDIFCLPSASESFGIVFLEAWHMGKPVIAADIPACRELVGGCAGGLTVPQTPQAISEAIITLLSQPRQREQMAARGREAAGRYTIEQVTRRIQQVYYSLGAGTIRRG